MRSVATLVIRDANLTIDSAEVDHRVEQFVDDAYYQESHLAKVGFTSIGGNKLLIMLLHINIRRFWY